MSKKRSSWGEQEYIPAGNGDASGEYADESGSNRNFQSFEKPDKETSANDNAIDATEPEKTISESRNNFINFAAEKFSVYGQEGVDRMIKTVEEANEECLNVLNKTFEKYAIKFIKDEDRGSYFNPGSKEINYDADSFNEGYELPGEVIFHELGHYLNECYQLRENYSWYKTDKKLVEINSIHEDGKSLAITLQEETKEFANNKYAVGIRKEKEQTINKWLKEAGHDFKVKDYTRLKEEVADIWKTSEEWKAIRKEVQDDYYKNGVYKTLKEANKVLNERKEQFKKESSFKDKFKLYDEQRPIFSNFQEKWLLNSGMAAVSDVWSSKSNFGFGVGHPRDYYNKSYENPDPENKIANEFFANFFAALTVNNKNLLETTKKYFPRSCEKVMSLLKYIKERE